jgi:hypothetical protein
MMKTPEDKLGPSFIDRNGTERPAMDATLNGPAAGGWDGLPMYSKKAEADNQEPRLEQPLGRPGSIVATKNIQVRTGSPEVGQFIPEQSPQPGKELTLFLQYKSKIKKFVLSDGLTDLSIARLQLAFIEKFAWNTHSNGIDLPEIYIQDSVSGVRHELEDLADVKDRSVLVLNIEVLDEVKKHIDEGLGGLRRMVEGVRTAVDDQQAVIQQVSNRQQDTAKEMARLATAPVAPIASTAPVLPVRLGSLDRVQNNGLRQSGGPVNASSQVLEVQSLRRDLAVMRQTFTTFAAGVSSSMATIRSKATSVKAKSIDAAIPSLDGDSGRAYVNAGKKTVGEESENIVNRVDDLQDLVEDLRKDVVMRGVRPLPRQLETVGRDISAATTELKKMQEYLRREKPIWSKIWEKELETVCDDREFLTLQEELVADLEDDLEKATQTFALVEQATKQQNLQTEAGNTVSLGLRSTSRGLPTLDADIDPVKAKDGVLGEVRALQPNHETRLEAIERAEKLRMRELESRREGPFTKELGNFVEEGKLRKSGGVEEAERLRKAKDERNRREAWEKQLERKAATAAKAARGGAAADDAGDGPAETGEGEAGSGDAEAGEAAAAPVTVALAVAGGAGAPGEAGGGT